MRTASAVQLVEWSGMKKILSVAMVSIVGDFGLLCGVVCVEVVGLMISTCRGWYDVRVMDMQSLLRPTSRQHAHEWVAFTRACVEGNVNVDSGWCWEKVVACEQKSKQVRLVAAQLP